MSDRLTRNEQREAARTKAKALREQHRKGEQRKRLVIQASVVLGTLGIVAAVAFAIISGANTASNSGLTPKNFSYDNGIKLGANAEPFTSTSNPTVAPTPGAKKPVAIQVYLEYQCPACAAFEVTNGDQIKSWLDSGFATLEIHPISFLDGRATPNEYSSRAANAAVCVAENSPKQFFAFTQALYKKQPQEGTPGPSNDEIFATAKSVGITNADKIKTCIDAKSYGAWIKKVTTSVLDGNYKVPGSENVAVDHTPIIVVNGKAYTDDITNPARFAQFVQKAASGS